jgi:hypothetical protein
MSNPKLSKIKAREQAGKDGELIYYTRAERCYLLKLVKRLGKELGNQQCSGCEKYFSDPGKPCAGCREARELLKELEQ